MATAVAAAVAAVAVAARTLPACTTVSAAATVQPQPSLARQARAGLTPQERWNTRAPMLARIASRALRASALPCREWLWIRACRRAACVLK